MLITDIHKQHVSVTPGYLKSAITNNLEPADVMATIIRTRTQEDRMAVAPQHQFIDMIRRSIRGVRNIRKIAGDLLVYWDATAGLHESDHEYRCLLQRFLSSSRGQTFVHFQFDTGAVSPVVEARTAREQDDLVNSVPNWSETRSDLHGNELGFVMCTGIECLYNPAQIIAEIREKMAPGGQIWIEAPFNTPYAPDTKEYWRFSPAALKALMLDFDEIFCSIHQVRGSFLQSNSFFYGLNRTEEDSGEHGNEKRAKGCAKRHLYSVPKNQ
ncbi:hypothetical protein CCR95_17875 [Thiocystis minor]|uniref:hypothetical protein n=1 Tax=Thiocystis minor TaxID=61597 RepID=UPI00191266EC|nr:hypothetical protein [Thiocystis minor]MBK5965893.1 hypothetical protein [Thiocystis minor]